MKKLLCLIFILFCTTAWGATTTIYVDLQGDDSDCTNSGGGSGATGCNSISDLNGLNPTTGNDIVVEFDGDDTFTDATLTFASWAGTYPSVTLQSDSGQATFDGSSNAPIDLDDEDFTATIQSFVMKNLIINDQGSWDGGNGTQIYIELEDTTSQTYDNIDGNNASDGSSTYGSDFARIIRPGGNVSSGSIFVEIKNCDTENVGPEPFALHGDSADAYVWEIDCKNSSRPTYFHFHNNTSDKAEADMLHARVCGDSGNWSLVYDNTSTDAGEEAIDIKSSDYIKIYQNVMTHSGTVSMDNSSDHISIHAQGPGGSDAPNTQPNDIWIYDNYFGYMDDGGSCLSFSENDGSSTYTPQEIKVYRNYFEDCDNRGITMRYYVHDIEIYQNIFDFDTSGTSVDAMILWETSGANIEITSNSFWTDQNMDGIRIENGYGAGAGSVVESNAFDFSHASALCYYDESGTANFNPQYNTWDNSGGDELNINGGVQGSPFQNNDWEDPGFVDPANGDLSLSASSNARGNADGSNYSVNGLKDTSTWNPFSIEEIARDLDPDAGAYEYTGVVQRSAGVHVD